MRIIENTAGVQAAYAQTLASAQGALGAHDSGKTREIESSFDHVDISSQPTSESRFRRELAARLVQDVRASTSIANVQQLREQVQTGTYRINPSTIAGAMLLEG